MRIVFLLLASAALAVGAVHASNRPVTADQKPGRRFEIRAAELPAPYANSSVRNPPNIVERGAHEPAVPAGFKVTLFADRLKHPRKLLVLDNGDVLLAEQRGGYVTFLRDSDGDGKADIVSRFATGFQGPYGMAVVPRGDHKGDILVADTQAIWRIPFKQGDVRPAADHVAVTAKGVFGPAEGHVTRSLVVDPGTGAMFVGVGSMGNIAEDPEPKATIQRFDADGRNQTTVVSGTRNPIGIHFDPSNGKLWAVVQERDGMGDMLVPDYMTEVSEGDFYGWPYAYTGGKPQPGFARRAPAKVEQTKMPDLLFEAHSSAMDFAFVPKSWPEEYRGDAIVALRGSWNRAEPTGYKLVRVKFEEGKPVGWYENFVTGFWIRGDSRATVWGRPASVAFLPDGGLLIADDTGGTIWKVSLEDPATGAQ